MFCPPFPITEPAILLGTSTRISNLPSLYPRVLFPPNSSYSPPLFWLPAILDLFLLLLLLLLLHLVGQLPLVPRCHLSTAVVEDGGFEVPARTECRAGTTARRVSTTYRHVRSVV